MMGIIKKDNLKRRMRFAKRLACLSLAGLLCICAAVTPYAEDMPVTQAPAVTSASEDITQDLGTVQTAPADTQVTVPSEPAVTEPAVTDTDVTEPAVTDITDTTPTVTDPADVTDITQDPGDMPPDTSEITDGGISAEDSFIDENGVMFFTLTRGVAGSVRWTVGVNSGGYYTLLVEGAGEVPSDILSQPDVAPYRELISKVQIRNGITSIGENAFRGLSGLSEVRFDDNFTLEAIGNGAFADCPLLRRVNLESCRALTSIGSTDPVYTSDGSDISANPLRATGAFSGTGLNGIVIPASLGQLGHCTFYNCTGLTDVRFEGTAQDFTFGADVFESCTSLRNINLEALRGNIITRKIDVLEKYNQGLFRNCDSLESIIIPPGFGYNGSPLVAMFNDCDNLRTINFEENFNITGENDQINNIISGRTRSIEILDLRNLVNLTEIGKYNIRGDKLSIVYLPPSIEKLDTEAFSDCDSLTAVVFPEGSRLKFLGNACFIRNDNIVSVNLENTVVEVIGDYAFQHTPIFNEITFPKTLKEIRTGAFDDCPSLSKINYNAENLSTLGGMVFNGASRIDVAFGSDVKVISEGFLREINGHAGDFTFAPNISFAVEGNDGSLAGFDTPFKSSGIYSTDADGNLYKESDAGRILVMASKHSGESFTVPADVIGIASHAFRGCSGITAISFENIGGIADLGAYAFANCNNLADLIADGETTEEIKARLEAGFPAVADTLFVNTKLSGTSSEHGIGGARHTASYKFYDLELLANQYDGTLLTGEAWKIHINASHSTDGLSYRLYVKCEDGYELTVLNDGNCKGPIESETDNIFYYEISNGTGETVQLDIPIKYPNGTAPGKIVQLWAVRGSRESFGSVGGEVVYPEEKGIDGITADEGYLQMEWTTMPKTHRVTKTKSGGGDPSFAIRNGSPTLTELNYDIDLSFISENDSNNGADNSIAVQYRDVISLPAELAWAQGLRQAIESRKYNYTLRNESDSRTATLYVTVGSVEYKACSVVLSNAGECDLTGLKLEWDAQADSPAIIWQVRSKNRAQLPSLKAHLSIGDIIVAGVGFDELLPEQTMLIDNTVYTSASHQFSPDDTAIAECQAEVSKSDAKLTLSKDMLSRPAYLGEDVRYRIILENKTSADATADQLSDGTNGGALVLHDGLYPINADYVRGQYIRPENIERLLAGEDGRYLRVVISQAVLTDMNIGDRQTTVITVDGQDTAVLTPSNTANVTNNYSVAYKDPDLPEEQQYDSRHTCSDEANVKASSAVITIEAEDGAIRVTVDKGDGSDEDIRYTSEALSLKDVLDDIGYIVTRGAQYDLYWTYPAEYVFRAGEQRVIEYTATVKDSFKYTPRDMHYYYNYEAYDDRADVYNFAEIMNPDGVAYDGSSAEISTEAVGKDLHIGKGYFVNGEERTDDAKFVISDNDELEYSLRIEHVGSSSYDVMPCVDSMVGPQVLLVEAAKNPQLEALGLPKYKYRSGGREIDCYILKEKGTYNNVWIGGYCADSVTVTDPDPGEEGGLKTIIKWYFKDTIPRAFKMDVRYKALVSIEHSGAAPQEPGTVDQSYKLDNTFWLNDHPEHRLYDYIGTPVSVTAFKKTAIRRDGVELVGDMQYSCPVGKGNSITYRLDFTIKGNGGLTLNNNSIFDILPETGGQFAWGKDNIRIGYGTNGKRHPVTGEELTGITYGGTDLIGTAPTGDEWYVESSADGKYHLKWNDGFIISIGSPGNDDDISNERAAYIYVTLSFPNDDTVWTNYYNAIDSKSVINTLSCNGLTSNVSHILSGSCEAFIQKGVYETGSFSIRADNRAKRSYYRGADRTHYATNSESNQVFVENFVTYYVVIANTGKSNLYLSTIYDILPEGFEFYSLCASAHDIGDQTHVGRNEATSVVECGWGGGERDPDRIIPNVGKDGMVLKNHKVRVVGTSKMIGNRKVIEIEVENGNRYDPNEQFNEYVQTDEQGRKFLAPNRYIQFGITCRTSGKRVDHAENVVLMEYLNYTDSLLRVDGETQIALNSYSGLTDFNDGERLMLEDRELTELIGGRPDAVQPGESVQWLASSVTVEPGEIQPGIEKKAKEQLYKIRNGNLENEDGIVWTVTSYNDGTEGISNYRIVDTLDYPLRFEGDFRYRIEFNNDSVYPWDSRDGTKWVLMSTTYPNGTANREPKDAEGRWINLFSIERSNNDDSMKIWSNILDDSGDKNTFIVLNPGENKNLSVRLMYRSGGHVAKDINIEFQTAPVLDSAGRTRYQETLIVTFADAVFTIVPNGKSVFEISSKPSLSAPAQDRIGTFNNTAQLVPAQDFARTAPQGVLSDYNGEKAVENSDQIATYSDSPTMSVKKIEAVGDPENLALSTTPSHNKIYVDSTSDQVRYTLTVINGDDANAMSRLVIIDNLPYAGDRMTISWNTTRDSDFAVSLPDDPGFAVTVTSKNGEEETVLQRDVDYTVQYLADTSFDRTNIGESDDWNGGNDAKWSTCTDPTRARSFRVVITKSINAGDRVNIGFNAVLDESAKPGQLAWNSFGYCFETTMPGQTASSWLYAAPLKVGVGLPELPTVQKRCVIGKNGAYEDYVLSQPETFDFFIFTGGYPTFDGYTAEKIEASLIKQGKLYAKFSLTVPENSSLSKKLPLVQIPVPDGWEWKIGTTYNIIEAAAPDYKNPQPVLCHFIYQRDEHEDIIVENIRTKSIEITKVDRTDESRALKNAVFGLYTLDNSEKMSDNDIAECEALYDFTLSSVKSIERDGITYYLYRIAATDENGRIRFDRLTQEDYLIKELKAPEGYYMIPAQSVQACELESLEVMEITVQNRKKAIMPATGGRGCAGVMTLGALLALIGAGAFAILRKRRA